MIRIICSQNSVNEVVVASVNLCNELNKNGYECTFYGRDNWHLDKCQSQPLTKFNIKRGDTIIAVDWPLTSYNDFFNLNQKARNLFQNKKNKLRKKIKKFSKTIRNYFKGIYYRKFKKVKFIFSIQGIENIDVKKIANFYDKIHLVSKEYLSQSISNYFICPNIEKNSVVKLSKTKNVKIAGIIGDIYSGNKIEDSISKAVKNGAQKIIIYGFMKDPIYFYKTVDPLLKEHSGKIDLAGFVENDQEIFNNITDLYFYPQKITASNLVVKAKAAGVNFYCNNNVVAIANLSTSEIFSTWKKELND